MKRWYLVYCRPNQEARAEINLSRQGFEIYRPLNNTCRKKSSKNNSLFPRYLFINVDPQKQSIAPVSSTLGVIQLVKFGNQFATASDRLIREIQRYEAKQLTEEDCRNKLVSGDVVYLDTHGFDQIKAIYCNPCGVERAMILLNILGNDSKIKVPITALTKLDAVGT